MSNKEGRPQRQTTTKGINTAVATFVVLGVAMAVPILGSGMANAASVDAWDKVAMCESSGLWNRPDGDGGRSSGGLQFQPASWSDAVAYLRSNGVDTSGYPQGAGHQAYKATKEQQIMAGEALLALQGPGAWTCNAKVGSPLQYSGPNASMFKGGADPYPVASSPATPSTPTKPSTPSKPVSGNKYTVQSGDTLSGIASLKKVAGGWQVLYKANLDLIGSNPNLIKPGQVLAIPQKPVKYTVKSGDNLTAIAAKYKVPGGWTAIYDLNKAVIGSNPHIIKPGQVLTLPGAASSAPSTPATRPAPSVPAKPSTPATPSQGYVAPLSGPYIMGDNLIIGSGGSMSRSAGGHSGLDLTAPQGTPVKSVAAGTVVHGGYGFAGAAYGNHVIVKHADGMYTLYAHLSANTVSAGQSVSAGQMIGNVGSTGNSNGPHLHFEVRTDPKNFNSGIFLNPVKYLASKGVTL